MLRLDIHEGLARRTVNLELDRISIGRDPNCTLELPGDPTVSRHHAILVRNETGWAVEDGGSRNGTAVNGQKVTGMRALQDGDRLSIGNFVLVLNAMVDPMAETTDAAADLARRAQLEAGLSAREIEVLRALCRGRSDQEIAEELFLSIKTVHSHLDRIRDKTGCRRRPELIRFGIDHGLI